MSLRPALRHARSGHRERQAVRDGRKLPRQSVARIAVVVAAVTFPAALGLALPATPSAPPAPVVVALVGPAPAPAPVAAATATAPAAAPTRAPLLMSPLPERLATVRVVDTLRRDEALSSALARHGSSANDVSALVRALREHLDVRALRAGLSFTVAFEAVDGQANGRADALRSFELRTLSPAGIPRTLRASRMGPTNEDETAAFVVAVEDAPLETRVEGVAGVVRTSLYQALLASGEDANLVDKFVDVFAWNVDFYRQTQRGDEFRVLVEKQYAGGRFIGYGKVLAAEYINAGHVYRGFIFDSKDGKHRGTYDDEGNALQRTFLKSPVEVARLTSSYGMRFHPVLGTNKKHEGVDYGAPPGTPVWTVADGVVREAKWSPTAGNMVVVQHMNGITTEYFHLSKFAEGIKPGVRIVQKQLIGNVGSTGMSTGPHLHFGMLRGGVHVDPSKQTFPNAKPVPKDYRREYLDQMQPLLEQLKALDRV